MAPDAPIVRVSRFAEKSRFATTTHTPAPIPQSK